MSKSHDVGTRGIVINRFSSGEGSVRVHLFTEKFGLISSLAQSAREERSKLRPHLQVGTFGNFNLVNGARTWRVVGAVDTKDFYFSSTGNPNVQHASARVMSLLRQLISGEEKDGDLFESVWNFLTSLETITDSTIARAERLVVLQILASLGYAGKDTVPPLDETFNYSESSLNALEAYDTRMHQAIKDGFTASGLI